MTEAEKLAQRLDELQAFQQSLQTGNPIPTIHGDAAALIREQEAKIKWMGEALRDAGIAP